MATNKKVPAGLAPIRGEIERRSALRVVNDIGPKDTEYCNTNHAQAVKACLEARSYYNNLMKTNSLSDLRGIKNPREWRRYLTEEEREKSLRKDDHLIIQHQIQKR